jgi:predicted short-subunit dehydrogenase-like oxidoreductase (DUF2520 family)
MKKQPPIALVSEGPTKDFPLSQLPGLLGRLGPVKSSSSRVASRLSNTLRAGTPVEHYKTFENCPHILLSVGESLPRIVAELAASGLVWKGRTVVACGNTSATCELSALAAKGAAVGSFDVIGSFAPPHFVVEGDPPAVRFSRTLVSGRSRVFEITKSSKTIYSAGITIATSLLAPTAAAGVQCLRLAGMPLREAMLIVEKTIAGSLRAYVKAGPKGWMGTLAAGNIDAIEKQLDQLHRTDPLLERYLRQNAILALEMFSQTSPDRVKKMARMLDRKASTAAGH